MEHMFALKRKLDEWRYNRLAKNASLVSHASAALVEAGFASQCGQDKWVVESCFPGMRQGVFVDVGAHDGVTFSNTHYLESVQGWSGLAIEPMPEIYARLKSNRRCVVINGCIASSKGTASFRQISGYSEMLSGLVDQYDARHLQRISREVDEYGGSWQDIEVQKYRLNDLLQEHKIETVHYMNVDVEGAELEIIRSIDFSKIDIRVCGIENNYRDPRIPEHMRSVGYRLAAIVGDEMYVKEAISLPLHVNT